MNSSRRFFLWGSLVAALVAAVFAWQSNREVDRLSTAEAELSRTTAHRRATLDELEVAVASLKSYLGTVQSRAALPASYEAWGRLQQRNRAAVALLRQRSADLEAATAGTSPSNSEFTATLGQLSQLTSTLVTRWTEYDRLGTGLTPKSQRFAVGTLLPFFTDELEPTIGALRVALKHDSDRAAAELPGQLGSARHGRLIAGFGLLVLLGTAASLGFARPRRRQPVRPAPPPSPVVTAPSPPEPSTPAPTPVEIRERVAALPRSAPKLLIAEQNRADGEILSFLLTQAGYAVFHSESAATALSALRAIRFDAVLLERQLPGAAEVMQEASQSTALARVILIVAVENASTNSPFIDRVVAGVVCKPVDPKTLLAKVTAIVPLARPRSVTEQSLLARPAPIPAPSAEPPPPPPPVPAPVSLSPAPEPPPPPPLAPDLPPPAADPDLGAAPPFPLPDFPAAFPDRPARKRLVRRRLPGPDDAAPPEAPE